MKKGESLRVFIENVQVGRGEITAVREGEIEVTVPGFVSVIATRTSLTDEPTSLEENTSNREVQVTGVVVVDQNGEVHEGKPLTQPQNAPTEPPAAPVAPVANAPVEVPTENTEAVTAPSSVSGESTESTNTDQ